VKLVSAAGFQLKGSGWYATDFKGSGRKAPDSKTDSKTDGKPAGETKAGTGAESKAATSTESPKPAGGCGSGCACH
jgi:predicted nucleic acid-binding Zn ribbon protein